MRQITFATLLMLVLLGTNVACNTVHGFGQDVERAGEKTQDAADSVKKKM
jgi:predicted small secreted protein